MAEDSSPARAAAVTERVWACVSLQWDWLGGAVAPGEDGERTQGDPARRRRAHQDSSHANGMISRT